jgi:signal transduction histidine kinase
MDKERISRLERAYGALCACNSALVRAISEQQLLDALCQLLVTRGGYRMAWVGYAEVLSGREVKVRAVAGANEGYLDEARLIWADDALGSGPTGTAIRTGLPHLNRDSRTEGAFLPWRALALRHDFASSLAVPLQLHGNTFGALSVYSRVVDAFDAEERSLLSRFAEDLSFAIGAMRSQLSVKVKDEQLRRASRLEVVGQLTSGIVHDFHNLLLVVQSCGAELVGALPVGGSSLGLAQDIVEAARQAEDLSRRLLTLARAMPPSARVQSLGPIIEGMEPLLRRVLGWKVKLTMSLASGLGEVDIDAGHLEQVLLNLVINARDAMRGGGQLTIGLGPTEVAPGSTVPPGAREQSLELWVKDTGSGMAPELVAHIFEPFFTTKAEGEGTGLGLAVVSNIVEHYGGRIAVESVVGAGTTFRLFFRRAVDGASSPELQVGGE